MDPGPRREPSTHRTHVRTTTHAASVERRLLRDAARPADEGTWTCVIDVRKTPEDVRVTDHALILRLPPHLSARRLEKYCVVQEGGDGDGDEGGFRYLRVSVHGCDVEDEKSAPGVGHPGTESRHPRALCRVVEVDGGDVVVASTDGGYGDGGNASGQTPGAHFSSPKKRVALVIDGFTHLAHRARPGRCFEAFGGAEAPGFEQAMALSRCRVGCRGGVPSGRAASSHAPITATRRRTFGASTGLGGGSEARTTARALARGALRRQLRRRARVSVRALVGRVGASARPPPGGGRGGSPVQALAETPIANLFQPRLTPDLLDDVADGFIASMHFTHAREVASDGRI